MRYTSMLVCKNCKAGNYVDAEKGTTIEEECLDGKIECRLCGCLLYQGKKEKEDGQTKTTKAKDK